MFCQECGKKISDDSKFCQYCGFKINPIIEEQEEAEPSPPAEEDIPPVAEDISPEDEDIPPVEPVEEDNKEIEKDKKGSSRKSALFVILAICVILAVLMAVFGNKSAKPVSTPKPTTYQQSKSTATPAKSTATPAPINSAFSGTWRDQVYREGNDWIQYELIVDADKNEIWINTISDAGRVKFTGPDKITNHSISFFIAGGFSFRYDKNTDTLETDSPIFTPPFERYSDETNNTAFGANANDYRKNSQSSSSVSIPSSAKLTNIEAFTVAEYVVKEFLVSPSTAKFCKYTEATCSYNSSTDRWTVKGWVDSQNTYGATIRQNFTAVFQPVKDTSGNIGAKHGTVDFN